MTEITKYKDFLRAQNAPICFWLILQFPQKQSVWAAGIHGLLDRIITAIPGEEPLDAIQQLYEYESPVFITHTKLNKRTLEMSKEIHRTVKDYCLLWGFNNKRNTVLFASHPDPLLFDTDRQSPDKSYHGFTCPRCSGHQFGSAMNIGYCNSTVKAVVAGHHVQCNFKWYRDTTVEQIAIYNMSREEWNEAYDKFYAEPQDQV